MEPRNKTSSDHFYDDTVNTKCNNGLVDKSTSIEGTNAHHINQNKPTASETHQDMSIGKDHSPPHIPPKPIMKSFHKLFSSESANKPIAFPATKTNGDRFTDKDLSPPIANLPPKPIVKSIHKPMSSSNKPTASPAAKATHGDPSTGKDLSLPHLPPKPIVKSIHDKPVSSSNKPTASPAAKATHGDPSTGKDLSRPHLPPKPIVKSIHDKPVSSSNKPTASSATKTHGDPSTGKDLPPKPNIPPKPAMKSINERLFLRQQYALLDVTSRNVISEYHKPNFPPPLPPKHKKISTSH